MTPPTFLERTYEKLQVLWRRVPKPIRSGWITAWVTLGATFLSIVTTLLPELANAVSTRDFEPFYDSLSVAATLAVSAVTAFFAGLVNAIYRWLRPIEQAYQTPPVE